MSRVNNAYRQWSVESELRATVAGMRQRIVDLEADVTELEARHAHAIWERDQALLRVEELER